MRGGIRERAEGVGSWAIWELRIERFAIRMRENIGYDTF